MTEPSVRPDEVLDVTSSAAVKLAALVTALLTLGAFLWRVGKVFRGYVASWFRLPQIVSALAFQILPQHPGGKNLGDRLEDIDSRLKILEIDARRARSSVHVLLSQLDHPVWITDAHGRYEWCNPMMIDLLDRSSEELLGSNWKSVIAPEDRQRIYQEWEEAVKEKRNILVECNWVLKDGKRIPVRITAHPTVTISGELVGHHASAHILPSSSPRH